MKNASEPAQNQLVTLDLAALATVTGGRYGVNRPRNTSTQPKRRR
jgi:hypothetical protein